MINSINISETFPDALATKYWHLLKGRSSGFAVDPIEKIAELFFARHTGALPNLHLSVNTTLMYY